MAFNFDLNRFKDEIFEAGKTVGDRLNDASAVVRTGLDSHIKEEELKKMYENLGRAYYQANRDNPDLCAEAPLINEIKAAESELEALKNNSFAGSKASSVMCPFCGAQQRSDASFCSSCGSALK